MSEYKVSFDDCITQLKTLKWKYNLPYYFEVRLDDVIEISLQSKDRDETASRVADLIGYLYKKYPDYKDKDKIRMYLNGVMGDLYGSNN